MRTVTRYLIDLHLALLLTMLTMLTIIRFLLIKRAMKSEDTSEHSFQCCYIPRSANRRLEGCHIPFHATSQKLRSNSSLKQHKIFPPIMEDMLHALAGTNRGICSHSTSCSSVLAVHSIAMSCKFSLCRPLLDAFGPIIEASSK